MQRISIAALGFLLSGPIPEGAVTIEHIPEGISMVASPLSQVTGIAISSCIANTEEEEVADVLDSEDKFEVFNRAWSPETSTFDLAPPI